MSYKTNIYIQTTEAHWNNYLDGNYLYAHEITQTQLHKLHKYSSFSTDNYTN